MSAIESAAQGIVDRVAAAFGEAFLVSHTRAAEILGTDPKSLHEEVAHGRIKPITKGKRRVYTVPIIVAYLTRPSEDAPCRSTGQKRKTGSGKARTGNTTSPSPVVDFQGLREKRRGQQRSA